MHEYLDAMERAPYRAPPPPQPVPVVLAALGPKMLELACERTVGAHPYFVSVEHTRRACAILGPGKLLAPEQAVVLATNRAEARAIGDRHTRVYLTLDNYRQNLLRLGWSQDDVREARSDEL